MLEEAPFFPMRAFWALAGAKKRLVIVLAPKKPGGAHPVIYGTGAPPWAGRQWAEKWHLLLHLRKNDIPQFRLSKDTFLYLETIPTGGIPDDPRRKFRGLVPMDFWVDLRKMIRQHMNHKPP